jgi:hypothetical protein
MLGYDSGKVLCSDSCKESAIVLNKDLGTRMGKLR